MWHNIAMISRGKEYGRYKISINSDYPSEKMMGDFYFLLLACLHFLKFLQQRSAIFIVKNRYLKHRISQQVLKGGLLVLYHN